MRRRLVFPEGGEKRERESGGWSSKETEEGKEIAVQEFELLMREIPRYFR